MRPLSLSLVLAGLALGWVVGCQGPSDQLPPISNPPAIRDPISDWPQQKPGADQEAVGSKDPPDLGEEMPSGIGGSTGGAPQNGWPGTLDAGTAPSADSDSMAPTEDAGVAPDGAEADAGDASSEAATQP